MILCPLHNNASTDKKEDLESYPWKARLILSPELHLLPHYLRAYQSGELLRADPCATPPVAPHYYTFIYYQSMMGNSSQVTFLPLNAGGWKSELMGWWSLTLTCHI